MTKFNGSVDFSELINFGIENENFSYCDAKSLMIKAFNMPLKKSFYAQLMHNEDELWCQVILGTSIYEIAVKNCPEWAINPRFSIWECRGYGIMYERFNSSKIDEIFQWENQNPLDNEDDVNGDGQPFSYGIKVDGFGFIY